MCGSRRRGAVSPFPEDCIQFFVDEWWVEDSSRDVRPGSLLKAFAAYPEPTPYVLTGEGRRNDRDHSHANIKISAHRISDPLPRQDGNLPVAGLPVRAGEALFVVRGKVRPVVVIAVGGDDFDRRIAGRAARWQTRRALLVAPYYSIDRDGSRGGWNPDFVSRIRRAEYPQYLWDLLPIARSGEGGSILRFDNAFSVSQHGDAYAHCGHRLSDEAVGYLAQWFRWLVSGELEKDSPLDYLRSELRESQAHS